MLSRNSSLLRVFSIRPRITFMDSIGVISAIWLRNTHMRSRVILFRSRSSRLVDDATQLTAGKMRLLLKLRSSCSSILPVPLNSSKITSSILLPVSISAVAIMVSEPPPSMLRAAPKKRLGFWRALASTPPVSILPLAGATVL